MSNEKMYLPSFNYNLVRVINEVAYLVEMNGGKITYSPASSNPVLVHTLGYDDEINEYESIVSSMAHSISSGSESDEFKALAYRGYVGSLNAAKKARSNALVVATPYVCLGGRIEIMFELNGYLYSFESDGNPFSHDMYGKRKIRRNKRFFAIDTISLDNVHESKKYLCDELFKPVASERSIKKAADLLLSALVDAPVTRSL